MLIEVILTVKLTGKEKHGPYKANSLKKYLIEITIYLVLH